jgi:hypothetical protein
MSGLSDSKQEELLALCKTRMTLDEICRALGVREEAVLSVLAQKLSITPQQMRTVFSYIRFGDSLQGISGNCSVEVDLLEEVFSKSSSPINSTATVIGRTVIAEGRLNRELMIPILEETSSTSQPNEDSYQGELLDGEPHGHGAMQYADGGTYIGAWVSGKKEGRGVFSWPSGDRYEGEFVNNLRHGLGTFRCCDGEVYTGSFQRDKRYGAGVLVMADGGKYTGTWRDSRKDGQFLYEKKGTSKTEVWVKGSHEEQGCLLA